MKKKWMIALMLLLAAMLACSLPISPAPDGITDSIEPSPGDADSELAPTQTNAPALLTPTLVPPTPLADNSATPVPPTPILPTETPVPPTSTSIPPTITPLPPTPTLVPPTPTLPDRRAGAPSEAPFIKKSPVIDGDWGDWDAYNAKQYPATVVVYGKANWSGEDDLRASYRVAWDNTFLYIAVKVVDDEYVQNQTGENIYKGDSVEILLDTDIKGDFNSVKLSLDDYQIGISPGVDTPGYNMEAYRWYPASLAGSLHGIEMAVIAIPGLYRLEAAIPWTALGVIPVQGMHFGFALSASDNDKVTGAVQQTMVSSAPGRVLTDPTSWGDLTLK
jgi:hypothetical protein